MEYKYITFKPEKIEELKTSIQEFQELHPEIDLYAYFASNPKTKELLRHNYTADVLFLNSLANEKGFPIELCSLLSQYIDLSRSQIDITISLKDINKIMPYKNQRINLQINEKEAMDLSLKRTLLPYTIYTINGLQPEEFYKRRKTYLVAVKVMEKINQPLPANIQELFKIACNPKYKIDKEFMMELFWRSIEKPKIDPELQIPIDRLEKEQKQQAIPLIGSYFEDFTPSEIKSLTNLDIEAYENNLYLDFNSIPDESLQEILNILREKKNIILGLIPEYNKRILERGISFNGINIFYLCELVSELPEEIINKFNKGRISIKVDDKIATTVSLNKYKILLRKLKSIVKGIPVSAPEKTKFKKVYVRLAKKLSYDVNMISDHEDLKEYRQINRIKSRNLENALMCGKAVCVGIAETLRQALSLVNITCLNCSSEKNKETKKGHKFSIVKIDGNWYNADLTWDMDDIKQEKRPMYCLKSDEEFEKVSSEEKKVCHIKADHKEIRCNKSLELFKNEKIKEQLKEILELIRARWGSKKILLPNIDSKKQTMPKRIEKRQKFLGENRVHPIDITSIATEDNLYQKGEKEER